MIITGTIINTITILTGSAFGILFRSKLPDRYVRIIFQAIGLFTLLFGIYMGLKGENMLVMLFSLIAGGLTGELFRLDSKLEAFANAVKKKTKVGNEHFSEGMVTAFLLYCMGPMTVLGAIDEGLGNGYDLLLTKSIMDGFASIALASALGIGVAFSILPLLIYQGGLTILSVYLGHYFSSEITNEMISVGGVLLVGLGIDMLEIKKIRVLNLLPSLVYAVLFGWIFLHFFTQK